MAKYEFLIDGEVIGVEASASGDLISGASEGHSVTLQNVAKGIFVTRNDTKRRMVAVARHKDVIYVDVDSVLLELREPSEDSFGGAAADHGRAKDRIVAPMPGKIVKIMVAVGDAVDVKQPMVIVEAMKMENMVVAKAKGRVKAVNFAAGDQVDTERPIIELELAE